MEEFSSKIELTTSLTFIFFSTFTLQLKNGSVPFERLRKPLKPDCGCSECAYRESRRAPAVWVSSEEEGDDCYVWLMGEERHLLVMLLLGWSRRVFCFSFFLDLLLQSSEVQESKGCKQLLENDLGQVLHIFQQTNTFLLLDKQDPDSE